MNSLMRIAVLCAVTLGAISCIRSEVDQTEQSGLTISLSPNFGRSDADASQGAATRVTSTDFESGDALGLYVVLDGRDLAPSGNAVTNGLMSVLPSGVIAGQPLPITYPSRTGSVHFYSYYPYSAVVSDIAAHRFAVRGDQTLLVDYKASDFCYGRSMGVSPSATAKPISYSHKMSQLLINVSTSVNVGAKKVTGVKSGVIYGVQSDADLNLSTGVMTTAAARVDSVKLYRDASVTTTAVGTTTHFTAIVPAQTFAVGGALMNFLVTFSDGSSAYYIYNSTSQVALIQGAANVFNLVLGDLGAVSLSGDPTVAAWASVTEGGILTQQISNSFSAIWKLPIKDYKRVNSVVLGINDPVLGSVRRQVTTGFSINADNSADKVVFKFNFASDEVGGLTYPYTIDYVEFCEGVDSLRRCSSVIAASVTRRGAYTLGVDAEYVVALTVGDFDQWDDLLYGDITRGVDNDFRVSLIEYPDFAKIATLKLKIDGEVYVFNDAACIAGSNQLIATTKDVRFPDANGRAPYKYPFTIERVELCNSGGSLITGGGYLAAVAVNRAGLITMRLYKGVVTSTTASVTGYGASSGQGRPEFGGAVENNPLRVVYSYGSATAQLSCLDVEKVEVVINNQTVVLSGYKSLMAGSVLAAQSSSPHVNIASGSGSKPTVYPYYISKISLKKADGTLLFSSALDVPLKVDWYGEVTVEIMEKMDADIPEVITIGDLRWATGNLVADGKGGAKIGAPIDGGVYFQFGSLLGWKGGASGDGTGVSTKANGSYYGGATFNAADEIAVKPSVFTKIGDIGTTWPDQLGNLYYFGDRSYAVAYARLRDFEGFADGGLAASGVGDPCRYYLGGSWRLPTIEDYRALCNNAANGTAWASNNAVWQGSPAGGNFNNNGTKLFIPASGLRSSSDGAIYYVGTGGYYCSESVHNATGGYSLNFFSDYVYPQHNLARRYGLPARCVQSVPTKPQPPTAAQTVTIGGLKWATGNLVADGANNAKVGKPTDGGLYFQFGSLLGWKGGASGDGTGISTKANGSFYGGATFNAASEIAITPTAAAATIAAIGTTWPNQTTNLYYFGDSGYATAYARLRDFAGFASGALASSGVGDPCRVYLGGDWRLPTAEDCRVLCNNAANNSAPSVANAAWQASPAGMNFNNNSTKLFFPASGYRANSNGTIISVGKRGSAWSESVFNAPGCALDFNSGNVNPHGFNYRQDAFPVRCVEDVPTTPTPPTDAQTVTIGGLKWTTGNLVANGGQNAKVGAVNDHGLYFQFGSLLGWRGGASGDGVGISTKADNTLYGGATFNAASEIAIVPTVAAATIAAIGTTWPNQTTNLYYFGDNSYATAYAKLRDFAGFAAGSLASSGVGDPCRAYLGGDWRLPTAEEYKALCNNAANGSTPAASNAAWQASPAGMYLNNNSTKYFIPASGFRRSTDGVIYNVGGHGYYWSESIYNADNGSHLHFSIGIVNPQGNYHRRYGFPVRCVEDVAPITVPTPPTAAQIIVINGLKWTTGNLIANGSANAKVGKPTDGGLYFQFGSLLGWKGGASGDGTGVSTNANNTFYGGATFNAASEIAITPTVAAATIAAIGTTWPNQTTNLYYFGDSGYATAYARLRDFAGFASGALAHKGVGDPCRYYLGGSWRLPTAEEYLSMCNNYTGGGSYASANAAWQDSPSGVNFNNNSTKLFLPASGLRIADGSMNTTGTFGRYWSESIYNAGSGYYLYFHSGGLIPQANNNRRYAFPVRCVADIPTEPTKPTPPTAAQIVTVGSLKWTTGNLIADGTVNCKVGAPTDHGLYFQFGSLIGWSGGASGDGVGTTTTSLAIAIGVRPAGYTGGTGYTNCGAFFSENHRDELPATDVAATGIGDPCRLYLGSPWRQPTKEEFKSMCNNYAGGADLASANAAWQDSPAGMNFNNNGTKLFIPASGRRDYNYKGSLANAGTHGYYWSVSRCFIQHSYNLSFSNNAVNPQSDFGGRDGMPARCVSS